MFHVHEFKAVMYYEMLDKHAYRFSSLTQTLAFKLLADDRQHSSLLSKS